MEHSHTHILEVSWNGGTPKSSIWFSDCHGFSIITHPASSSYWGTPIYEPPHFGSFQPLALDLLGQGQLPRATNKSCSGRRSYFLDLSKVDHGNQTHSLIMVLLFSGDRIPKNEPYPPATSCGTSRDNMCDAPYHCWASCYWRSGYTAWHKVSSISMNYQYLQ
jgi:hypothetical protein